MSKIITHLTDCDLYKFTMQQAVFRLFGTTRVKYEFLWRNIDKMHLNISIKDFTARVKEQIESLCELAFTNEELSYLASKPFFKSDYIEYLENFHLNKKGISITNNNDILGITIEGTWVSKILYEIYVLSIVSELYTKHCGIQEAIWIQTGRKKLEEKLQWLNNALHSDEFFNYGDFGTRRRASKSWHEETIITQLSSEYGKNRMIGTSNVYFAMKYNIPALGTQAHEWYMVLQQLFRIIDSQSIALQKWADIYRGDLGIALSDTFGFDFFLCDFDKYFAKLFDGVRHDSGPPILWCRKLINHYKKLGIDPRSKTALFSDGLTLEIAVGLYKQFNNEIKTAFGIGTNISNDCGFIAPQVVMKPIECNGLPVCKISDSSGKTICKDTEYLSYLKKIIIQKTGNKLI